MKVEIWSDLMCPWCGLANYRLDVALERFEHSDEVELVHRSYVMSPNMIGGDGISQREVLRQVGKVGQAAESYIRPIEELAKRDGLQPYIVMDRIMGNTQLVHEFFAYASEHGRNSEVWHQAFREHFAKGRKFYDVESIVAFATEFGFDAQEVREILESREYRDRVTTDQRTAVQLGAQGVPFTVIDERYGLSGAQEIDTFLHVIERAWNENHRPAPQPVGDTAAEVCADDSCAVPAAE